MTASLTFFDGQWRDGNVPLMGSLTHAVWLSSVVFDGARAFDGAAPDLLAHCHRVVASAGKLGLKAPVESAFIFELAWAAIKRFAVNSELYIRPMFFAEGGFIVPDPDTTRFALVVSEAPMPQSTRVFSATRSPFIRPLPNMAPVDAKASCLYPNVARSMAHANRAGFDNSVVLDPIGNVAEFGNCNLFFVRDKEIITPVLNGTFLNGITRQRVIGLLRGDGWSVAERTVRYEELFEADEIFSSGNWAKVQALGRLDDKDFQPGPVFRRARELYWDFARGETQQAA
jgi:branched-chain amino acid aminotransferase